MIEIQGDIFDFIDDPDTDAICITTNGMVGADGRNTMGAGVAGIAKDKWPDIRKNAGTIITNLGNVVGLIGIINKDGAFINPERNIAHNKEYKCLIFSFPTKEDIRDNADIELIIRSSYKIANLANKLGLNKIIMPVVGCGCGGLNWEYVKPKIVDILDDRFWIVSLEGK